MRMNDETLSAWIGGPPLPGARTPEALSEVLSRPNEQVLLNAEYAAAQRQTLTITSQTDFEAFLAGPMKPWNVVRVSAVASSDAVPCLLAIRFHPTFETNRKIVRRAEGLDEVAISKHMVGMVRPSAEIEIHRGTSFHCLEVAAIPLQTVSTAFTATVCVEFSFVSRPC